MWIFVTQVIDLLHLFFHEFLTSEARLYRHHQYFVHFFLSYQLFDDGVYLSLRFNGQTYLHFVFSYLLANLPLE